MPLCHHRSWLHSYMFVLVYLSDLQCLYSSAIIALSLCGGVAHNAQGFMLTTPNSMYFTEVVEAIKLCGYKVHCLLL